MTTNRSVHPFEPSRERRELVRLVRQMQDLALELQELRRHAGANPELHVKERTLEQLRCRLAALARRAATDDLGNAA
jgi:hypothetical protein